MLVAAHAGNIAAALAAAIEGSSSPFGQSIARESPSGPRQSLVRVLPLPLPPAALIGMWRCSCS